MIDYQKILQERCGFVTEAEVEEIAKQEPLKLLLVRCGCGRFLAPAQDVKHFIGIIEKEKSDYIRDVSIPVGR